MSSIVSRAVKHTLKITKGPFQAHHLPSYMPSAAPVASHHDKVQMTRIQYGTDQRDCIYWTLRKFQAYIDAASSGMKMAGASLPDLPKGGH